jgi:hypothetical protein
MENEIRSLKHNIKFYFKPEYFHIWNNAKVETIENLLYRQKLPAKNTDEIYRDFTSLLSPQKYFPTLFTTYIKILHPDHECEVIIKPTYYEINFGTRYYAKTGSSEIFQCMKDLGFEKSSEYHINWIIREVYRFGVIKK